MKSIGNVTGKKAILALAAVLVSGFLSLSSSQGDTTLTGDYWITEKLGIKTTAQDVSNIGSRLTVGGSGTIELQYLNGAARTSGTVAGITSVNGSGGTSRFGEFSIYADGATNSAGFLFSLKTAGTLTERMRITSAGNVGIGVSSPTYKLDVAGSVNFTGTLYQNGTPFTSGGGGGWVASATNAVFNAGNVGIGTSSPTAKLDVNGGAILRGSVGVNTPNLDLGATGSTLSIGGISSGGLELQNTGTAKSTGNVAYFTAVNGSGGTTRLAEMAIIADGAVNSGGFVFSTKNSGTSAERMRVSSNGMVGIGTSSPAAKLDITQASGGFTLIAGADVLADNRTNATEKIARYGSPHYLNAEKPVTLIVANSTSTQNIINVGGGSSAGNAATDLRFYTASSGTSVTGNERMRITPSGNVGIGTGTNSVTATLEVSGSMKVSGAIRVAPQGDLSMGEFTAEP